MSKDKDRPKPSPEKVLRELQYRGVSLASIGRNLEPPVSRQQVHRVLHGERSARVRAAIAKALGWNPWAASHFGNETGKSASVPNGAPRNSKTVSGSGA